MDSTVLRTFIDVVETGSLVGAAKRLNVTQSTVTARINSLEQEIGQKLIHRNKAGTELTSAGFKLVRYAEVMLQLWRQARTETSLPEGFSYVCSLGCEVDLWQDLGPRFLEHIKASTSAAAVSAWPGNQRQIGRWLSTGFVDVALSYVPEAGPNFAAHTLFDEDIVLATTSSTPIDLQRDGIRKSGYVYVDHGDDVRRQHAIVFTGDETAAITLASCRWAIDYLRHHGGSAYLPMRHVRPMLQSGFLYLVENAPRFKRRVYLVANTLTTAQWNWFDSAITQLREVAAIAVADKDRADNRLT